VKKFMVERYLPGVTAGQLDQATRGLASAAAALAAEGVLVRYLSSTFVPTEESCFCRFEGGTADDVRLVCEQARVPYARIFETHDFAPSTGG
jgi:Nickel responsive protein SCO4226-like